VIEAGLFVTVTATGVMTPRLAQAQTPRLTPPPPCRVTPADTAVLSAARTPIRRGLTGVAVLEFDSRVVDARRAHLAPAVTAQLRSRISTIHGVTMESRGSVERVFSAAGGRVDSLLSVLGDEYAIIGDVIPQRDRIDITVRILQQGRDTPRWERVFAYPRTSIRQIEESVAGAVAELAESRVPARLMSMSPEAYEIALRGDYFLAQHDATSADSARRTYERAVAADRRSAVPAARAARARAELLERLATADSRMIGEQVLAGMTMVDAALSRDSSSAEAWTARALLLRYRNPVSYAGVVAAHERAVAADPTSADAHEQFGITLMQLGKDGAAEQHLKRALSLDANRARTLRALGDLEYLRRRYGPSCALANASIGADPYDPLVYSLRARVRMQQSEFRDALSDAEIAVRLSPAPWSSALQLLVTASGTTVDDARLESKRVAAEKLRPGIKMTAADGAYTSLALEALGDRDRAFEALRRIEPTGVDLAMALRDPRFDPMRGDPRFRRISATAMRSSTQAESTSDAAVNRTRGSVPR
jgi:tetratricopeptide (TPR) repeat protein/TolB-like protein